MTKENQATVVRRLITVGGLTLVPGVLVLLPAAPAAAATPNTWEETDVPGLEALLLLVGGPLLLFVGIWLLVMLPSLISRQKYDAAVAFSENPEWFGGPRSGAEVEPADSADPGRQGGSSAHW